MKFWADHDMPGQLLLHEKEFSVHAVGLIWPVMPGTIQANLHGKSVLWYVVMSVLLYFLFYVHLADRLQTKQIVGQQGQSQVCWVWPRPNKGTAQTASATCCCGRCANPDQTPNSSQLLVFLILYYRGTSPRGTFGWDQMHTGRIRCA